MASFPMPFRSHHVLRGCGKASYIAVGMFTDRYRAGAQRLAASCERFRLAYELHEVPAVHRSISIRGTQDLAFTKANFIWHMLTAHTKPILYIDADCEIVSPPVLIDDLVRSRHDFAIYNWCADQSNDYFKPIELNGAPETGSRYYRRGGGVLWHANNQMLCSGCVQFYKPTLAARGLLKMWHRTIASMADCADDMVLDFTFNNLTRRSLTGLLLRPAWLPKAYARYAWWIYDQPVINHPDFPAPVSDFKPIVHPTRKRFYLSLMWKRGEEERLPLDCVIDTEQGQICRLVDGKPVPIAKIDTRFWL